MVPDADAPRPARARRATSTRPSLASDGSTATEKDAANPRTSAGGERRGGSGETGVKFFVAGASREAAPPRTISFTSVDAARWFHTNRASARDQSQSIVGVARVGSSFSRAKGSSSCWRWRLRVRSRRRLNRRCFACAASVARSLARLARSSRRSRRGKAARASGEAHEWISNATHRHTGASRTRASTTHSVRTTRWIPDRSRTAPIRARHEVVATAAGGALASGHVSASSNRPGPSRATTSTDADDADEASPGASSEARRSETCVFDVRRTRRGGREASSLGEAGAPRGATRARPPEVGAIARAAAPRGGAREAVRRGECGRGQHPLGRGENSSDATLGEFATDDR